MNLPFDYERMTAGEFGGTTPTTTDFEHARVVILPVPLDRTTSYVPGTRNGPHEILVASSHMELWDEETQTDVHSIGIFTLPEVIRVDGRSDGFIASRGDRRPEISSGAAGALVTALVAAAMASSTPACWCRRSTPTRTCGVHGDAAITPARCGVLEQAARRSGSQPVTREAAAPALPTEILRLNMRRNTDWISGSGIARRQRLHHHRLRRLRPAIMPRSAPGARRPVVVRRADAASPGHRVPERSRLRYRGTLSAAR